MICVAETESFNIMSRIKHIHFGVKSVGYVPTSVLRFRFYIFLRHSVSLSADPVVLVSVGTRRQGLETEYS
jgi:hypothetical protein